MLIVSKITSADPAILKIEGRIDGLTSKQIQAEIEELLGTGVKNLV
jgi:anti-anti-sigma regulatory factor